MEFFLFEYDRIIMDSSIRAVLPEKAVKRVLAQLLACAGKNSGVCFTPAYCPAEKNKKEGTSEKPAGFSEVPSFL